MDYNIYIRTIGGNGQGSDQTTPWTNEEERSTKAWSPEDMQGGESQSGQFDALKMSLLKKIPAIAIAYAIFKIGKKVIDTAIPYVSRETGDYRFQTEWNNTWTGINAVLRPLSTTLNAFTFFQENRIYNQKQEQARILIGDSYLNANTRRY